MRAFPVLKGAIFSLIALSGTLATNVFASEENIARFYDDNQSYWAQFLPTVNSSLNKGRCCPNQAASHDFPSPR